MFYLTLSLSFYIMKDFCVKQFGRKFDKTFVGSVFQTACALTASMVLLAVLGGIQLQRNVIMLYAVLFGIVYAVTNIFLVLAMGCGPMGQTGLICDTGLLIGITFGVLFCQERFTLPILLSMVLLFSSVLLLTPFSRQKTADRAAKMHWFWLALASALCNGVLCSIKKGVAFFYPEMKSTVFMFWAFVAAALVSWIAVLVLRISRRENVFRPYLSRPALFLPLVLLAGAGSAVGNAFQLSALTQLPAAIVYSITTAGGPMANYLFSVYFFKEMKLTRKNTAALVLCIAGILIATLIH